MGGGLGCHSLVAAEDGRMKRNENVLYDVRAIIHFNIYTNFP